jgi:DNA-binding NarL/FixJ family response regulator
MTCRILIVDDNQSFRKGMQALLEIQPDMSVCGTAQDGRQALELIDQVLPDLVLLDAQMPGLSGVEVAHQIKGRWPGTRVILMTMYPDYRSKAMEAGADAFLIKGIPPEDILAVIRGIREAA